MMYQQRPLSPIRLKAITAELHRLEALAEQETQITGSIKPVSSPLPLDSLGRPYLSVNNPYEPTIILAKALIDRFCELMNTYPAVILLSKNRYFPFGECMEYYYLGNGVKIPYVYESHRLYYDALVRGK